MSTPTRLHTIPPHPHTHRTQGRSSEPDLSGLNVTTVCDQESTDFQLVGGVDSFGYFQIGGCHRWSTLFVLR